MRVLGGCEGGVDMALFGRSRRPWFGQFLELPHGIPSHDPFGRVFALLDAALLRRRALSVLTPDTRYADSLRCKRLRAGWETSALEHFLAIFAAN